MKRVGNLVFAVLAVALMLGANAFAAPPIGPPSGDFSSYFVTYYSNANTKGAPDATLRLVNDGDVAVSEIEGVPQFGNLFADIYVFDDSQELQECCSCVVTPDGLLSESISKNLTANELTGRAETSRGVIKILSDFVGDPTNADPTPGLRGWMTHIQATIGGGGGTVNPKGPGPFYVTEDPLADSNLSGAEYAALSELCSLSITLGSGYGICSCTPEDHDF